MYSNSSIDAAQNALVYTSLIQTNILRHFRSNKATSSDTAITMENLDWIEIGINPISSWMNNFEKIIQMHGIRKNEFGKYWLDVESFLMLRKRQSDIQMRIMYWALGLGLLFTIFSLLLPTLLRLQSGW